MRIQALTLMVLLAASGASACVEETKITFLAGGRPAASEVIGQGEACDDFGGNMAQTPRHGMKVFVNFNIPGTIDLDGVDRMLDALPAEKVAELLEDQLTFVTDAWYDAPRMISGMPGLETYGGTSMAGSLFIAARALADGKAPHVIARHFSRPVR